MEPTPSMSIENFPTQLQGIIQQDFLDREFLDGLKSKLGYRAVADREPFPNAIGETVTKTRKGLKAPVTTPLTPSANTNFDNGLTPTTWSVEQYTNSINMYGDTIDLNTVTERVGIALQFMANAKTNGTQAVQSLDRLARNALFGIGGVGVGGYLGGNTRVRTTLGSAAATISVDDIRGFQQVFNAQGQLTAVSSTATMTVLVNVTNYTLIGATADGTNVSTSPNGVSGTLTFSGNVSTTDGTANNLVLSSVAPLITRPNNRATTAALTTGDTMTMQSVLAAVARLRSNNVPTIDGLYNCYLDDQQLLGLFQDPQFQLLFRGAYELKEYKQGDVQPARRALHPDNGSTAAGRLWLGAERDPPCDRAGPGCVDRRRLRRHGGGRHPRRRARADQEDRRRGDDHPSAARPAAPDHRSVLVLGRWLLCADGHDRQPHHHPDREQLVPEARRGDREPVASPDRLVDQPGRASSPGRAPPCR